MSFSPWKRVLLISLTFLFCSTNLKPLFSANVDELVSKSVDQMCEQLIKIQEPEPLFHIQAQNLSQNLVYAKWLEPSDFVTGASKDELKGLNGSLAYARVKAPFFRVAQTIITHEGEPKFIPGIKSTKVLTRKRESNSSEYILIERDREVPVALKPFILSGSKYKIENMIRKKENAWILVRVKLAHVGKNEQKTMMKAIEGFEFAKDMGNGEVLLISGGFALPNLGFLKIEKEKNENGKQVSFKAPINKATFGFLDKVTEKLDVKSQVYKLIADSIVEGTFQSVAAVTQVTTDERWKSKWAYQLTKDETRALLKDNREIFERAKKNNQITYKSK